MPLQNAVLATFNRGLVDSTALARIDVSRIALAAETQTNWMSRALGSMGLRPATEYVDSTLNGAQAVHIPFVFANDDTAIIEITENTMRVRYDEQIVTRNSVSSTITNGSFTSDVSGWTDADETGATSQFATGGYLSLAGTDFNAAIRRQTVTVIAADRNVQHGIKIIIKRGAPSIRIGSSAGTSDYVSETVLAVGEHSFAFTPAGDFYIDLLNRTQWAALVDSIAIESAGDMTISVPWSVGDLENLRWEQSADVVFVSCNGFQQRRIERRGTRSWSLVKYETEDGPFRNPNTSTLSLTPNGLSGDITLTASRPLFTSDHVGSLFRIRSIGQKVSISVTDEAQFSDSIRVIGVDTGRVFTIDISGTWTATVTLQRSIGEEGSWTDVTTYTSNQTALSFDDGLDNQIIYYRIGVDTGDFTSGPIACSLTYSAGSIPGIVRITAYTSATSVSAAVIKRLGQTVASTDWDEGIWSDERGWPSSLSLYEGRLWWFGKTWVIGSVSDAYASFDDTIEGKSAPIIRTIASGPVDKINWALALQRLIIGTLGAEVSLRSTAFDEPLTVTNFNIKEASTQGSAPANAAKVDTRGVFVEKSAQKLYELNYDIQANDYGSVDLSILVPEIGDPGFVRLAVQRKPDTRIHCIRSDGTVAILIYNPVEDVKCWLNYETNGEVEDIIVMPGDQEDVVYYTINRLINGSYVRYLEKFALETECVGGTYNCQADSFRMFINNPASATVSGLDHLEGEEVIVWYDGKCPEESDGTISTFTVSGGSITLGETASQGIVGLTYSSTFKSAKLPFGANLGTTLGQRQRISKIGLMLENTHYRGLKMGPDSDHLTNLPLIKGGTTIAADTVHATFDEGMIAFNGPDTTDSRVVLVGEAPRPVYVKAAILGIGTHDTAP